MAEPNRTADTTEQMYEHLVETANEPLFAVDPRDSFEVVNGEFLSLVGYDRSELLGTPIPALFTDDAGSEWAQRRNLLQTEPDSRSERWSTRLVTKQGTEVVVTLRISPIETADGETIGFVGRATDERERKRREQRLNILNRALRHNIRNRMNVILGHVDTLREIDDDGYRLVAEQIGDVSTDVINISNKARKAHKHLDVPPDEECRVDLAEVTREVVRSFGISYPTATVRTDLPEQARARAPPTVGVALTELLENTVVHHSTDGGTATVTVDSDGLTATVRVEDECPPVPDSVTDCLDRGEEHPLDHNEGLGLWIVQWITDTVGGDLSFARRADDAGNVVTLTFDALPA